MKKTDQIRDTTNATMVNVEETSGHFREISGKIDEGRGTIGALVNDRQFYDRLNAVTTEAKMGAAAFQENMQALKTNFFLRGFFNRRGYDDSTKLTLHEISSLPESPEVRRFTFEGKKIFSNKKSANLKSSKALNEVGNYLQSNPFGLVVAVAYTGLAGDSEEAEVLTQARAMVVRDYLVKNFKMDDTRFMTKGLGKQEAGDPAEDGRLEIRVYPAAAGLRVASHQP